MNQISTIEAGPADQAFIAEHFDIPGDLAPGIYPGISNDAYHAGPGISKSGLWTIYTQTPAHYRFADREEKAEFDFGTAVHSAILEPETFEDRVFKGPDDRRGNKWKDAQAEATNLGKLLLTGPDYEAVQIVRDAVHADAWLCGIITGGKPMIEHSAYAIDPATGLLVKCRPDLCRQDLGVILDVKTAASAHPDAFARAVVNYGYHAQEAHYTDTWRLAGGEVEAFAFLVVEKKKPFAFAVYELPPSIVDEGRAIISKAMATYAECTKADRWPGYAEGVQELSFQRWSYRETAAPEFEEA